MLTGYYHRVSIFVRPDWEMLQLVSALSFWEKSLLYVKYGCFQFLG